MCGSLMATIRRCGASFFPASDSQGRHPRHAQSGAPGSTQSLDHTDGFSTDTIRVGSRIFVVGWRSKVKPALTTLPWIDRRTVRR